MYLLLATLLLTTSTHAFWRMPCNNLLVERADPIVSPGKVASHVHTIQGGSNFGLSANFGSLRQSKCTSCLVTQDMSNYWVPSLYFQFANGTFQDVPQVGGMLVYYLQRRANDSEQLFAFPDGFSMVAGTPSLRSYADTLEQRAISFVCLAYTAGKSYPQTSFIPPYDCPDGLRAQVFFPSCWDGINANSSDHKSHMAYPDGMDNGACPSTHPVRLVSLFYETTFSVTAFTSLRTQARNATQPFVFSTGDVTGYGFHGDFLNGWDKTVLQTAVSNCNASSGVIEECSAFKFNDPNAKCHHSPDVNEVVTGQLTALPGCNPVTSGPAPATSCTDPKPPSTFNGVGYTGGVPPTGANVTANQPSVVASASGFKYIGCGMDGVNGRSLPNQLISDQSGSMTIEKCMAAAASSSYRYAGVEYARECWAGNVTQPAQAPEGDCSFTCTGNSLEYCGAGNRLTLYNSTQWTQGVFTNPGPAGTTFVGCYTDNTAQRTFSTSATVSGAMTVAKCVAACSSASSANMYAGVEYAGQCYCDSTVRNAATVATPSSDPISAGCNMLCSGNSTEYCGGANRLNVYKLPSRASVVSAPASSTTTTAKASTSVSTSAKLSTITNASTSSKGKKKRSKSKKSKKSKKIARRKSDKSGKI
ncbi:uncharacterized protein L969DRAFT_62718 [Mixia osmundae IAM 14324]|uniref:uncharacterized protein n=1 Tax=Mixia osmundae (strain CBS 9802 / IAM 14324 / JCM 22182 / KY 12970) TaxID=764103 RepID=UPI0004A54B85|nr:uncharacterized protein L969DRAFT_62718 [Mixia osmundae IAM 14324]KEI38605.1 hypothetical protein L969DRAFT_62718 [Mixia osmundae IAM 14324]